MVLALSRADLTNFRRLRYRGDEQGVTLDAFGAPDRAIITDLYGLMKELQGLTVDEVPRFAARPDVDMLGERLRALGSDADYEAKVAGAIHDLRGGAVNALLLELASPRLGADGERVLSAMTRDVMKLARTLVSDLDSLLRARDLERRLHSIVDLRRALEHYREKSSFGSVALHLESDADGFVAASCCELGTVERVAFNLLHNAATHSARPGIEGCLVVIGENLRVAVANTVAPDHRALLAELLARDPGALYTDFSTTGSGRGLRIAADLVASAYGVETIRELIADGYVGTRLTDNAFVSWFHWPLAHEL